MKSTMQAKPNKRPGRLDYREPAANFPRKYFWARKTHGFILTETPPGEEPIPHAFQRRKSPWKPDCPPSSAGAPRHTPHVSRERREVTPARRRASQWGWGRKWGSGGNQALGAHPGAPQFWGSWLPRFVLPLHPRLVTALSAASRHYFAFGEEHFKTISARSFWCFPGQQKYQSSTLAPFVTR